VEGRKFDVIDVIDVIDAGNYFVSHIIGAGVTKKVWNIVEP